MLTAGYEPWRRVDAAAISIIEIIIMLTSFVSGGRAERMRGGDRSGCVIGIMGCFTGGSDALVAFRRKQVPDSAVCVSDSLSQVSVKAKE